ncbi:MAG: exosortase E/protease, VPEID-CTERM system, partial [Caldilineaceae bacterium]
MFPKTAHHAYPSPIGLRWLIATGVFALEILWLTSAYRAPDAGDLPDWQALLIIFNGGYHYTGALLFLAALTLALSARVESVLQVLHSQAGYAWWRWAVPHGLAVLLFAHLTSLGFSEVPNRSALSLPWLIAWLGTGTATFVFWLFLLAPPAAWLRLLRQQWAYLALALFACAAVWLGGILTQNLWQPLAEGTLRLTALLLSMIYPEVLYYHEQGLIGTPSYLVEIMPVCSGYEGIALVTVFVATYLWLFRKHLSFPRAFVLFPLGIVSIWLANVVRVTALVAMGTSVSPEVAGQGFHSQAGWIGFTVVTFSLIAISHRWLACTDTHGCIQAGVTGKRLEIALLAPLLTLMAISMITQALSAGVDTLYPLPVIAVGGVLWYYRGAYRSLFGSLTWEPFAIGALVFVLWTLLAAGGDDSGQALAAWIHSLPTWLAAMWIAFRVLGSVLIVPMAEELAFRGYLIRKLIAKDFENVPPGAFTWFSFITSSLAFGFLHKSLLAGAIAGAAFAVALYRRGRVGDAIIAHTTSNAMIAGFVLAA